MNCKHERTEAPKCHQERGGRGESIGREGDKRRKKKEREGRGADGGKKKEENGRGEEVEEERGEGEEKKEPKQAPNSREHLKLETMLGLSAG